MPNTPKILRSTPRGKGCTTLKSNSPCYFTNFNYEFEKHVQRSRLHYTPVTSLDLGSKSKGWLMYHLWGVSIQKKFLQPTSCFFIIAIQGKPQHDGQLDTMFNLPINKGILHSVILHPSCHLTNGNYQGQFFVLEFLLKYESKHCSIYTLLNYGALVSLLFVVVLSWNLCWEPLICWSLQQIIILETNVVMAMVQSNSDGYLPHHLWMVFVFVLWKV